MQKTSEFIKLATAGMLLGSVIVGCSSDSSDSVATGSETPVNNVSGVAAIGAPLMAADISLRCRDNATATTTTGTDGSWAAYVAPEKFPCVARATGQVVRPA